MTAQKLFMVLMGCRPPGRYTEQHDVFFGIGERMKDLIPAMKKSWPEAKGNIHVDAWREVTFVDGHTITIEALNGENREKHQELFFINLGGYKENEFDEFHYKMLAVAANLDKAKSQSRNTAFFKHTTLPATDFHPKAISHIDDKYGIDVDDAFAVADILPKELKEKYRICISPTIAHTAADKFHLGYFKFADL